MASSEAHSEAQQIIPIASGSRIEAMPAVGERRLRRITAWLLLIFLIQGELGAVWDREWHAYVGRDQFWTPPHTLIYSCVSGAGLLALAIVLIETFRYRRKAAGVNNTSTVPIFGIFHAPLGFAVIGFGALLALIAAPLDNYWHELYGIDIALWAPFHMMGVTGGLIGILGIIYVFASEASIERQERPHSRRYLGLSALDIGMILTMASLMNFMLTGFLQFPLITIGTLHISTYPLPLAAGGAFCFISAVRSTYRPGVATLLVFLLLFHTLLVELFVPWAIRVAVAQQGLAYRAPGNIPYFSLSYALLPLLFLLSALIVDGVAYWRIQKEGKPISSMKSIAVVGAIITPPAVLIAPYILLSYSPYAPVFLSQAGLAVTPDEIVLAVLISVPSVLLMGIGGALLGADFGDIWRWSKR